MIAIVAKLIAIVVDEKLLINSNYCSRVCGFPFRFTQSRLVRQRFEEKKETATAPNCQCEDQPRGGPRDDWRTAPGGGAWRGFEGPCANCAHARHGESCTKKRAAGFFFANFYGAHSSVFKRDVFVCVCLDFYLFLICLHQFKRDE